MVNINVRQLARRCVVLLAVAVAACGGGKEELTPSQPTERVSAQAVDSASVSYPSDTDEACSSDVDFVALTGDSADVERTLVSRHVDCRISSTTSSTTVFADLVEVPPTTPDGATQYRYATAQDIAAGRAISVTVGSFQLAELRSTVFGSSSGLTKTLRVRMRIRDFQPDLFYFGPTQARNSITARLQIDCNALSSNQSDLCRYGQQLDIVVPLNDRWSEDKDIPVTFNWTAPADGPDLETFQLVFQRFKYFASGSLDRGVDSPYAFNVTDPFGVTIRCDRGVAKARTTGCVIPLAAPVFVLRSSDAAIAESRQHVVDAFSTYPDIGGKFELLPGTRAIANTANLGMTALTRTREPAVINANRSASNARCKQLFGPPPVPAPEVCPVVTDVDADEGPCDCDEYPFASSNEGAAFKQLNALPFSVRRISQSDNRSAGAKLGEFYRRERVIDAEKFWVAPR